MDEGAAAGARARVGHRDAAAGAGAGGRGAHRVPGLSSPAAVLGLQRAAGNAAVSAILAREPDPPPPAPATGGQPAGTPQLAPATVPPRKNYVFLMGDVKNDNFYKAANEFFKQHEKGAEFVRTSGRWRRSSST
jgi:hypothetical protein